LNILSFIYVSNVASNETSFNNVFAFEEECFHHLYDFVKSKIEHVLMHLQQKKTKYYVQCWSNILRKGQGLPQHAHPYPLHGHISICTDGSVTQYGKTDPVHIENIAGDLVIFDHHGLQHSVPEYQGDRPRISIAFDLLPVSWVEADPRWRRRFEERKFIVLN